MLFLGFMTYGDSLSIQEKRRVLGGSDSNLMLGGDVSRKFPFFMVS